jgi:NAD(P)-dependent dehydrogenase (short-subunit alcohol dehydrogenase family)
MNVADRVAVVTGSGQGIGEGVAHRLAAEGAKVVVNDLAADRAEQVVGAIKASGGTAISAPADVATSEGSEAVVARAVQEWGRVDILVNNSGITRDVWLVKMSDEDWDDVLRVNLRSQFLCSRAVAPGMMERRHGRIVNIGSRAALGAAGQANYSASKGGVISFTRALALELAKFRVTVNCVAPGLVDTQLFRASREDIQERLVETIPMGRIGTPEDIAQAVLSFACDEASYVTGQVIYVCGGRSLASSAF